ncbi:unnamed protein product [Didymodactylos carnosus]|uniref:NADH dehydrogenase [ubiquinone] 1 beta subcomplex subunit 8, mitochondrial n=1 Tax=Didymodactylos carnosus TaxID=1234261 RepID=A0A814RFC3_9BILA|nr:unnamed protein product [Didymodactylos carnosus]CAF3897078.1 unnamed protein product [Didymodactylos carnosus]
MSVIIRLNRSSLCAHHTSLKTAHRTILNNRDWRPGHFIPKTDEEIAAVAKKYNMIPEDYKPLDPKHSGGDMPDITPVQYVDRSPWEDWDYPNTRQHYNEPKHRYEGVRWDRYRIYYDPNKLPYKPWQKPFLLMVLPATFYIIHCLFGDIKWPYYPSFDPQRVEENAVHYTFEKPTAESREILR